MYAMSCCISTWTFCNKPISQLTLDRGPSSRRPWRRRVTVSVCQESSQRGYQPIYCQTKLKHPGGRNGRERQHPDQITTQPTPKSIHSLEHTPSPREMNTTPMDPRGLHSPQNEKPTRTPPPKNKNYVGLTTAPTGTKGQREQIPPKKQKRTVKYNVKRS